MYIIIIDNYHLHTFIYIIMNVIACILSELTMRHQEYGEKVKASIKVSKEVMYDLAWRVDELTDMRKRNLAVLKELDSVFTSGDCNLPRQLTKLR